MMGQSPYCSTAEKTSDGLEYSSNIQSEGHCPLSLVPVSAEKWSGSHPGVKTIPIMEAGSARSARRLFFFFVAVQGAVLLIVFSSLSQILSSIFHMTIETGFIRFLGIHRL